MPPYSAVWPSVFTLKMMYLVFVLGALDLDTFGIVRILERVLRVFVRENRRRNGSNLQNNKPGGAGFRFVNNRGGQASCELRGELAMTVLHVPPSESLRSRVSLELR